MQSHITNEHSRSGQRAYSQYPQQTNSQFQPPSPPQTRQTSSQYSPQSGFHPPPPQRNLQPPLQTGFQADLTLTQQEAVYTAPSNGRAFQSEPSTQENVRTLTSVQPLANPTQQQNGNFVHSSPSYSKTKIYSAQPSHPDHSGIYPDILPNQFDLSRRGSENIELNRQSPSTRELQNFDETMDLLDSYANFKTPRRLQVQNGKANVMTVERINTNRDHEVPIYNRPERPNLTFTPRTSDGLQTEQKEQTLHVNDALKLMLTPYTKSDRLINDEVDEMTAKIFSTVVNESKQMSTLDEEARQNDETVKENTFQSE